MMNCIALVKQISSSGISGFVLKSDGLNAANDDECVFDLIVRTTTK